MPQRNQTPAEQQAMRELERAEYDCIAAHKRVEEAREHFIAITRAARDEIQRPKHLRLVRPDEHQQQSA
jgi:hypothetical protein